VDLFKVV